MATTSGGKVRVRTEHYLTGTFPWTRTINLSPSPDTRLRGLPHHRFPFRSFSDFSLLTPDRPLQPSSHLRCPGQITCASLSSPSFCWLWPPPVTLAPGRRPTISLDLSFTITSCLTTSPIPPTVECQFPPSHRCDGQADDQPHVPIIICAVTTSTKRPQWPKI